eukprot:jgi/Chrzof1/11140/Cz05g25110.t1
MLHPAAVPCSPEDAWRLTFGTSGKGAEAKLRWYTLLFLCQALHEALSELVLAVNDLQQNLPQHRCRSAENRHCHDI